jgi:hypothetical protein
VNVPVQAGGLHIDGLVEIDVHLALVKARASTEMPVPHRMQAVEKLRQLVHPIDPWGDGKGPHADGHVRYSCCGSTHMGAQHNPHGEQNDQGKRDEKRRHHPFLHGTAGFWGCIIHYFILSRRIICQLIIYNVDISDCKLLAVISILTKLINRMAR